jgi:hypothetical protein
MRQTMSVAIEILSSIFASAAVAAGCVWFAKRTIEHGFDTVMADRRSAFESSLEEKRQAFERELAVQRHAAEQSLEAFKAQLTLSAEVRRQAAAKRVEALLKIADAMRVAVETIYSVTADANTQTAAHAEYWATFRGVLPLFDADSAAELKTFGDELTRGTIAMQSRGTPGAGNSTEALASGERARNRLLDVIRRELQLAPAKEPS